MKLGALVGSAEHIFDTCIELLISKNADYSNNDDVHSNFKELAQLCRDLNVDVSTPVGCIQFMILMKTHRQFKLIREGKKPENESLQDTCTDKLNYEILLETLLEEEKL